MRDFNTFLSNRQKKEIQAQTQTKSNQTELNITKQSKKGKDMEGLNEMVYWEVCNS